MRNNLSTIFAVFAIGLSVANMFTTYAHHRSIEMINTQNRSSSRPIYKYTMRLDPGSVDLYLKHLLKQ